MANVLAPHGLAYGCGVPPIVLLFIDSKLCECAMCQHCECTMCHQTTNQMFNLHSYNLVEITTKFLVDVMPNQWMMSIH